MERIIDANLNRSTEALRVIEELARFSLNSERLSTNLKNLRHKLINIFDEHYTELLKSRNTEEDIGREIQNPSSRTDIIDINTANFKRLQQALRSLSEYSQIIKLNAETIDSLRYESYILEKLMHEELTRKFNKGKLEGKNLYLVTDRTNFSDHNSFLNAVAASLEGGVKIIQLREKTASAKEIIELGKKTRDLCALYDAVFIINDRVDIALALEADGVHLGQDDLDIKYARKLLGDNSLIGISTHAPEQAQLAIESGADYIGVGPVFSTPTKPGRQSVGLDYVKWASENVNIPWFAIGGINTDNVNEVINAGAGRIAVVRAIINANQPAAACHKFLHFTKGSG